MMNLLLMYLFYIGSRVFSGHEDGGVSKTEIALGQCRKRNKENAFVAEDTTRRKKWHKMGAVKLVFVALAMAVAPYGIDWRIAPVFISILALQVIIFNPIIALKYLKNKSFFYVSKDEMGGLPYGREKLYYFGTLTIFISIIIFLIWFDHGFNF